jgi:glycerol-3-phosphate cytidylyltransferase
MAFKKAIIAGSFDVVHPGYIFMLRKAKEFCDHLTIALQTDPTLERPNKLKPLLSWEERYSILESIRFVDKIIKYTTEEDLTNILKTKEYSVRILGDDYIKKYATGQEYSENVVYIDRSHGWSTTKYKQLICKSLHGE